MEVWGSGDLERYGPGNVEIWRHGTLEVRCRHSDVGGMKLWRRDGDLGTWRDGGMEVWSSGGALQA